MPTLEQHDPQVRRDGLKTDTAVSFGSTLTVAGATTLLSVIITSTLALSGALTGTSAVFSGQLTADTVSTTRVFAGSGTVDIDGVASTTVYTASGYVQALYGAFGGKTASSTAALNVGPATAATSTIILGSATAAGGVDCIRVNEGKSGDVQTQVWWIPTSVTPFIERSTTKPTYCP